MTPRYICVNKFFSLSQNHKRYGKLIQQSPLKPLDGLDKNISGNSLYTPQIFSSTLSEGCNCQLTNLKDGFSTKFQERNLIVP